MNITTSLNGAKENHVFSVISAQMVFLISYCVYNITQYPCSLGIITLNKGLWLRCPYFFGFCMCVCVCVYACKHTLVHSWIYQIYQKKKSVQQFTMTWTWRGHQEQFGVPCLAQGHVDMWGRGSAHPLYLLSWPLTRFKCRGLWSDFIIQISTYRLYVGTRWKGGTILSLTLNPKAVSWFAVHVEASCFLPPHHTLVGGS